MERNSVNIKVSLERRVADAVHLRGGLPGCFLGNRATEAMENGWPR